MIQTIVGIILLLIPFLLIYKFQDKKAGFAYILTFLIVFHLGIAILLQAFHIFYYYIVLDIMILADIAVLIWIKYSEIYIQIKKIKIDWFLIAAIIILFISLYSVHYNYTGKVTTTNQPYTVVQNTKYPYPYYSDEWVSVSMIKYSISSHSLPLVNPLYYDRPFPNLELFFHVFFSEMTLLLNLDPLTQYTLLSIFASMTICILIYLVLRINNVKDYIAAIAGISATYIVNSSNLPGLWTLIPVIMGVIFLILSFFYMSIKEDKMVLLAGILTLIFYPPLFIFSATSILIYFFSHGKSRQKLALMYGGICVVTAIILSATVYFSFKSTKVFFNHILTRIIYPTFTQNALPDFSIWKVIPIFILVFAAVGFILCFLPNKKKTWLAGAGIIGLTYWIIYNFSFWRFIIEYERAVFATSMLLIILSGFGLNFIIDYANKIGFIHKYHIMKILGIISLVIFFFLAFSYTQRENWRELRLHSTDGQVFDPASPANNYLHEDDLKLFKDIKEKSFLSTPWKGLVIGTATDNFPLRTKPATITNKRAAYIYFMNQNCTYKTTTVLSEKDKIDYVYSPKFDCPGFDLIGTSSEGFYLYKFTRS